MGTRLLGASRSSVGLGAGTLGSAAKSWSHVCGGSLGPDNAGLGLDTGALGITAENIHTPGSKDPQNPKAEDLKSYPLRRRDSAARGNPSQQIRKSGCLVSFSESGIPSVFRDSVSEFSSEAALESNRALIRYERRDRYR